MFRYKYVLDIDGNGWSARFKRLMSTNSAVLKSTIFPEWCAGKPPLRLTRRYTDRIQPWVHYIPIKADLTDLYDVLTFFRAGHDSMGEEIATEGKKWSKAFWRREDMVAYQFRWGSLPSFAYFVFMILDRRAGPSRLYTDTRSRPDSSSRYPASWRIIETQHPTPSAGWTS